MRDRLDALCHREKACCARRTIPAFEPLWPCLGPKIANGQPWNVASDRRGKTVSEEGTEQQKIVHGKRFSDKCVLYIRMSAHRIQTHKTVNWSGFGNDLIPFIRGERGQYVAPIGAPAESQYFLKEPILEPVAYRMQNSPSSHGLRVSAKFYLLYFSLPGFLSACSSWICSQPSQPCCVLPLKQSSFSNSSTKLSSSRSEWASASGSNIRADRLMTWSANPYTIHTCTSNNHTADKAWAEAAFAIINLFFTWKAKSRWGNNLLGLLMMLYEITGADVWQGQL